MNDSYASDTLKDVIWPEFLAHFKSETTKASYETDSIEFMHFMKKDFLEMEQKDVAEYFGYLQEKVKAGSLKSSTVSKKIRELHSLADYIIQNQQEMGIMTGTEFADWFAEYLPGLERQEQFTQTVPIQDLDRLFQAAEEDAMAYTILVLLYRAGLSATEIVALCPGDFGQYADGVYVFPAGRKEPAYIPEDAWKIVEQYLLETGRKNEETLFLNSRNQPLNLMYISRMLKKLAQKAGTPSYSARQIRSSCGATLYVYGADSAQVASSLGITRMQVKRYHNLSYRDQIKKEAGQLVRLSVRPPRT